jgi:hypothetical protein
MVVRGHDRDGQFFRAVEQRVDEKAYTLAHISGRAESIASTELLKAKRMKLVLVFDLRHFSTPPLSRCRSWSGWFNCTRSSKTDSSLDPPSG